MPLTAFTGNEGNATNTINVLGTGFLVNTTYYAQTTDGTATGGSDFTAIPTGARIAITSDGTGNVSIPVQILGDTLYENTESFTIELYTLAAGGALAGNATVTLTNDDAVPTVSIAANAVSTVEGNFGPGGTNTFDITLSTASGLATNVPYTVTGTGIDASDFVGGQLSGTVTIAAGSTTGTITLTTLGDRTIEADETFTVTLGTPTNATVLGGGGTATGSIVNDDAAGAFTIVGATFAETAGTVNITVSRTGGTGDASVSYTTASGLATQGTDFVGTSGTLNFFNGATTQTFQVTITDDNIYEGNEIFPVSLSGVTGGGTYAVQAANITINDNETAPTVQIAPVTINSVEGDTGAGGVSTFRVTQSVLSSTATTIPYSIAGAGITASDFVTPLTGTVVIAAGQISADISVTIQGDYLIEGTETYQVTLGSPTNATLGVNTTAAGTITNDDSGGNFTISNVTAAEGNAGTSNFAFIVTRSGSLGDGVTIAYQTNGGSATPGTDFVSTSGTLTFAGGATSQTVNVAVNGDTTSEVDETFSVNLFNASAGTIINSQGIGTITNDDGVPTLTIGNVTANEGQNGTTAFVFTVTRTGVSDLASTVAYTTVDGTAVAASDYAATSGTLNFAVGQTSQTVTVLVTGDTLVEVTETFSLQLSSPTNAILGGGGATLSGTGTITNDDVGAFTVAAVAVTEGNSGTSNATVTVTRPAGGSAITLSYTTSDGGPSGASPANAGSDYTASTGTVAFVDGQTTATFTVPILGDTMFEPNETFTVTLSGAGITPVVGYVTINNDDVAPGTTRTGTSGNDTFVITSSNDVIVEAVGGGNDIAFTQVTYVLGANAEVEALAVQNAASTNAIDLTGNQYTRTIVGNAGVNTIVPGSDNATLIGLAGNDTYLITTDQQVIVERAGEGDDTAFIAAPNFLLAPGVSVETLVAYEAASVPGAGPTQAINIAGNELNQYIFGNSAANIISGNGGDDTLDGGAGDDTYRVFSTGTVLFEGPGGGFDTVYASGTSYFLYSTAEIEYLSPAQQSATDPIYLVGNATSQVIIGNYGNNILNGRGGGNGNPDTLIGLFGDDTFGVFTQGDVVREIAGQGNDIVYANVSYQLRTGTSVEALSAVDQSASDAASAYTLRGNDVAQTIVGNNAANVLDGRGGNDTLVGLGGADTFAFTTALSATNVDTIRDFVSGTDKIGLASDIFGAVTSGGILANEFVVGASATTADTRLVYNQTTGQLFYDADANGSGAAVLFAQLAAGTAIVISDFSVIAPVTDLPAA